MSAQLLENLQYFGDDGLPLVGGKVYIGENGLEPVGNPITIYADRDQTTTLTNPQTLGTDGIAANKIWIPGTYSLRVESVLGVQHTLDLDLGAAVETGTTTLTNVTGSNAITANTALGISFYVDKELYTFTVVITNTTSVTLNIDGVGAIAVVKNFNQSLDPGDFTLNQVIRVAYNSASDNFAWVDASVKTKRQTKGTDIASASSITVPNNDGNVFDITGSTGPVTQINGIADTEYTFQTDSTPTFTDSASIVIEGGVDYTAAAGDIFKVFMLTSSTCRLYAISRGDGKPTAMFTAATQAEQETGSSLTVPVTPGRQQFHLSAAKAWVEFNLSGTIGADFNVTSVTDNGTGDWTVNFTTNFSSSSYIVIGMTDDTSPTAVLNEGATKTTSACQLILTRTDTQALIDPLSTINVAFFGDQ